MRQMGCRSEAEERNKRVVRAQARGQGEGTALATPGAATATALAAELLAVTRAWVRIDANGPLEATA